MTFWQIYKRVRGPRESEGHKGQVDQLGQVGQEDQEGQDLNLDPIFIYNFWIWGKFKGPSVLVFIGFGFKNGKCIPIFISRVVLACLSMQKLSNFPWSLLVHGLIVIRNVTRVELIFSCWELLEQCSWQKGRISQVNASLIWEEGRSKSTFSDANIDLQMVVFCLSSSIILTPSFSPDWITPHL